MPEVTRQTSTNYDSDEASNHPNGFVTYREIDGQRVNIRVYNDGHTSGTFPDGSRPTSRSGTPSIPSPRGGHITAFNGGRKGAHRGMSMRMEARTQCIRHHPYAKPTPRSVPDNFGPKNPQAPVNSSSQVTAHSSGAGGPTSAPTMTQESDEARGRRFKAQQGTRGPLMSQGRREREGIVPNEVEKIHYKERNFNESQEKDRRH
jgi:hypothetical protein